MPHSRPGQEHGQSPSQAPHSHDEDAALKEPQLLGRAQAGEIALIALREDALPKRRLHGLGSRQARVLGPEIEVCLADQPSFLAGSAQAVGEGFQGFCHVGHRLW